MQFGTRKKSLMAVPTRTLGSNKRKKDNLFGYLFISPQLIGLFLFVLFPVIASIYLCFTKWNFIDFPVWVGLDNFKTVFTDRVFYKAVGNTAIYLILTVPLTMLVSLTLAILTNRPSKLLKFYRAAFFLPMVTSTVSIALVWFWIYEPTSGILNQTLRLIGVNEPPAWLLDTFWSKIAVVIMSIWLKMGYYYIIFDAGIKNIPKVLYEAAAIDGASSFQKIRNIMLPLLSPVMLFVSIMLFIDVFNMFNEVYIMTKGGPDFSTYTLVMYIYFSAFGGRFNMGQAAVGSMVLFLFVGIITYLQFKVSRKRVHYE